MNDSELMLITNLLAAWSAHCELSSIFDDVGVDSGSEEVHDLIGESVFEAIRAFITLLGVSSTPRLVRNTDGSYYEYSDQDWLMDRLDDGSPLEFLTAAREFAAKPKTEQGA